MRLRTTLPLAAALAALAVPATASARIVQAESILPPGQSGFVSVAGLSSGTGSPHLYDQEQPFVAFARKSAMLGQAGTAETPKTGVRIVRDAKGVPAVYGDNDADAWWGAGYAIAQDRLVQIDFYAHATTGHLAELLGQGQLASDIAARRDYYTPAELDALFAKLPASLQARFRAYLDGVNAWVDHVLITPTDLPGEYAALRIAPHHFTLEQLLAIGVQLTRTTPNGDGSELTNAQAVKASGAAKFDRILPLRTPGQISTVPRRNGLFPSDPGRTRKQERAALRRSAKFVATLPLPAASENGAEAASASSAAPRYAPRIGGSYMVAVRTRKGRHAYLFNGPELGFQAPEELVELEVHAPGLDVRGVTAPGVPVIAIGHNQHVAWGVTSGLSMTNHLYAEQLVPGHPDEYMFRGKVMQMSCRTETFSYKSATGQSQQNERLCRTIHGPVQARAGNVAYARRYATWDRELSTLQGLAAIDQAGSVAAVNRDTRLLTWNENLMAADDHGNIGYWHPGLLPIAPENWDERLPYPGTGQAEWRGFLSVKQRPHVINPRQRWLANWNNIPSQGWTTGNDPASERVAGRWFRVAYLDRLAASLARRPSFARLRALVHAAGTTAQQRPLATAQLRRALRGARPGARTVLRTILGWSGSYDRADKNGDTAPGVTAWQEFKHQAQLLAIAPLGTAGRLIGGGNPNSEHVFDVSIGQAYALRTLSPAGWRKAASKTFAALSSQFHSGNPSAWKQPRVTVSLSALGAEQAPKMPFFDRGTWEQLVELKG